MKQITHYAAEKDYLIKKCEYLIDEAKVESYKSAHKILMREEAPLLLDGSADSFLTHSEREFSKMMAMLTEKGVQEPEKLTTMKYHSLLGVYSEQNKKGNGRN